ncbi:uncharacterized protein LOC113509798 [Galleria mellonella]|uniref:Uncharacterized protein LOC113509798 n=1 Tax=Galleria mellonella TaxID=7137 RepID=A0ABM3MV50_GALME|nr:uncharacterized protein LOC113509798 [Galleria mellonella]
MAFLTFKSRIGTVYEDVTTDVLGKIGVWKWIVVLVYTILMIPSIFNQYEDMFLIRPADQLNCIPSARWTPQSPQWLLYNSKIPIAEKILFTAAKRNVIKLCSDFKIRPVNHRKILRNFLSSIALAFRLVGHALILNITPRYFATKIRATILLSLTNYLAAGQLGAMISYLLIVFQPINDATIVAIEVAVTLTLASLRFIFLDVDGRELPDVLEDMDYFSELSKPLRWASQRNNSPTNEEVEIRVYSFGSTGHGLSQGYSEERIPAQRIGFTRIWPVLIYNFNRIFRRGTTCS